MVKKYVYILFLFSQRWNPRRSLKTMHNVRYLLKVGVICFVFDHELTAELLLCFDLVSNLSFASQT